MELADYLRALRRHWRGFVAITFGTVLIAALVTMLSPKVYTATAAGLVSTGETSDVSEASASDQLAKSRVKSYVDVAGSRAVAQRVIDDLQLPTTPAELIGQISITQPADTVLLKVSTSAATPVEASELADAWVHALAEQVASIEDPGGRSTGALRVIPVESAAIPTRPASPNPPRNLAFGVVLGVLFGLGYSVLATRLDSKLRSSVEIERTFEVTVAGTVPLSPEMRRRKGDLIPIVVQSRAARGSAVAESILKLRTNLRFMHIDAPPKVIVVTSPLPSDGKSTIAANLAAAFAVSGTPTLLIDADLRRPVVAESFGLVEGVGLSDVLVGEAQFEDVVQATRTPNLVVLASGTIPPNPSEMLGSAAMKRLLDRVARDYTVIIDAPPLLPVTDAAVLTANADGALIVISFGKTDDSQLAGCLHQMEAVHGTVLGVVVNKATGADDPSSYYYYGSGHGYSRPTQQSPGPGASSRSDTGLLEDVESG